MEDEVILTNAFCDGIKKSNILINKIKILYDKINLLYKASSENNTDKIVISFLSTYNEIGITQQNLEITKDSIIYAKKIFNLYVNSKNSIRERISSNLSKLVNNFVDFINITEENIINIVSFASIVNNMSPDDNMSNCIVAFIIVIHTLYKSIKKTIIAADACNKYLKAAVTEFAYLCACTDVKSHTTINNDKCSCKYCTINYTNDVANHFKSEAEHLAYKYNCADELTKSELSENDYTYEMSFLGV